MFLFPAAVRSGAPVRPRHRSSTCARVFYVVCVLCDGPSLLVSYESRTPVTTAMCRDRRSVGSHMSSPLNEGESVPWCLVLACPCTEGTKVESHEISLVFQRPDEYLGHLAQYALELRLVVALSLLRAHPRETEHASNER